MAFSQEKNFSWTLGKTLILILLSVKDWQRTFSLYLEEMFEWRFESLIFVSEYLEAAARHHLLKSTP